MREVLERRHVLAAPRRVMQHPAIAEADTCVHHQALAATKQLAGLAFGAHGCCVPLIGHIESLNIGVFKVNLCRGCCGDSSKLRPSEIASLPIDVSTAPVTPIRAIGRSELNYVLFILAVVSFFNYLDRMVLSMLFEPIRNELGFSDTQLGLLGGFAFAAFYATFGLPIARIADTRSRVTLLSVCMAIWSAMTAVCGMAQSFVHMLLARMGVGVGEAGCVPASHSLLSDFVPPERRAFALGIFQAGGAIGTAFGFVAAGEIADAYGWRMAFFLLGVPGVLVALLVKLTVKDPPRGNFMAQKVDRQDQFFTTFSRLLKRPAFVQVTIAYSLGLFGVYGLAAWIPTFYMRVHGMAIDDVGWLIGITSGIGGVIGTFGGAIWSPPLIARDRRWEVWWPAWAYLICVPLYVVTFMTGNLTLSFALVFVTSVIAGTSIGPGMASVQSLAEPRQRATAVAIVMFCSAILGQGLGPFGIGAGSDWLGNFYGVDGLRYAMIGSLLLFVWGVLHFFAAGRIIDRDRVS